MAPILKPVRDTIYGKVLMKWDSDRKEIEIVKNKCKSTILIKEDGAIYVTSVPDDKKEK